MVWWRYVLSNEFTYNTFIPWTVSLWGKVYLNSFREDEFKVNQIELELGNYSSVYNEVLVNHKKTFYKVPPVMYQAIDLYLEMLTEDNTVMKFISKNKDLSTQELLKSCFSYFQQSDMGILST